MHRAVFVRLSLAVLLVGGCGPGLATTDDEVGSETDIGEETSATPTETDESSETGESSPCEACGPDQLCVAQVESDICGTDFGYTLTCVDAPASCADDRCAPECIDALCWLGNQCVPECGPVPGVDVWCGPQLGGAQGCDPFAQDCPEGEKCVPYGSTGGTWDANKCVPILGDGQPGDPCTWDGVVEATDDCGAESHCWDVEDVDGELVGTCTEFCTGTADEPICPPESSCLIANQGSITLCIATCDPEDPDSCPEGTSCLWANDAYQCIFDLPMTGQGDPCDQIPQCADGYLCADASALDECPTTACCTAYCDLTDLNACAGLEPLVCVPFFEPGEAPPGYENVGVCILP